MATPRRDPGVTGPGGIQLLSAIRGRHRWLVPALARDSLLAMALEQALGGRDGIDHVFANPRTRRVLIRFDPSLDHLQIKDLLLECLAVARREAQSQRQPAATSQALLAPSEHQPGSPPPLQQVLRLALPDLRRLMVPVAISVISQAVELIRGRTFTAIINSGRGNPPAFLEKIGVRSGGPVMVTMAALASALVAVSLYLQVLRRRSWNEIGESVTLTLRAELYSHIQAQDQEFFNHASTGKLMQLIDKETRHVGRFAAKAGDMLVVTSVVFVVAAGALIAASPVLAGMISLLFPLLSIPHQRLSHRAAEANERLAGSEVEFTELLENSLAGITNIKSFTAEERETGRFLEAAARLARDASDADIASAMQSRVIQNIMALGWNNAAAYAGYLAATGAIDQSDYTWLLFLVPRILDAPANLEDVTRLHSRADRAATELLGILNRAPKILSGSTRLPKRAVSGKIEFEHVSFGYHENERVLKDVSFSIEPGQTVAVVGPTGSGKSTLLKLLMRFYDPEQGRVRVDGHDLRDLHLGDLRNAIGLVAQEPYVFDGTIRENLIYGRPDADEHSIREALETAHAHDVVSKRVMGLEANVGERGSQLSGGERQRLCLARSMLKGAPILALDEATSNVDYETEAAIQHSVQARVADHARSMIMIAHRLATVRSADQILVLDQGRICERGTHDELVASEGLYAFLWSLQVGDAPTDRTQLEIRVRPH